ncbi:MAG: efflux RND transporter periplasmic adaptor subunit [Ideonella sp.]|nr:efflux RND transporter periplasmic adaptor subunit [Ideonella sp.]MBL0151374.1 efflux RND transporter periplasmic adaptor subunit [Ideonella sp.]
MGIKHIASFAPNAAAGLLLGLALSASAANAAPPAGPVVPTTAAQGAGTATGLTLDGVVQPVRQATVAAQVGGNVLALNIRAGDRVKAGQVLARVDERDLQAGLQRTEAGVAQAEAELRNARTQTERTRELRAQGFVSQAALDVAETQLKAAQAGMTQAQAGRSQAALARGFSSITAPFDAVVLATHLEAGDLAAPGRPIVTLYAPGAMRAVVQVPASMAGQARAAREVQVLLADGRRIVPSARSVLPSTDPVSQTVEWRLDLPASVSTGDAAPSPGQSLQVVFSGAPVAAAAPSRALSVPASAVLRRGELTAVYVVQDQRFVLRAVRTGADRGAAGVEILAGLLPTERFAVDAVKAGLTGATPAAQ